MWTSSHLYSMSNDCVTLRWFKSTFSERNLSNHSQIYYCTNRIGPVWENYSTKMETLSNCVDDLIITKPLRNGFWPADSWWGEKRKEKKGSCVALCLSGSICVLRIWSAQLQRAACPHSEVQSRARVWGRKRGIRCPKPLHLSLSPDTEKILCSHSRPLNRRDSLPNLKLPSC